MFGDLVGSVLSNVLDDNDGDLQKKAFSMINSLISSQGGIQAVLDKFQSSGLGEVVQSWLGDGENNPLSVEQLINVFGASDIAKAGQEAGIEDEGEASGLLAKFLPLVVNLLSPNGNIEESASKLLSNGIESALGSLFK